MKKRSKQIGVERQYVEFSKSSQNDGRHPLVPFEGFHGTFPRKISRESCFKKKSIWSFGEKREVLPDEVSTVSSNPRSTKSNSHRSNSSGISSNANGGNSATSSKSSRSTISHTVSIARTSFSTVKMRLESRVKKWMEILSPRKRRRATTENIMREGTKPNTKFFTLEFRDKKLERGWIKNTYKWFGGKAMIVIVLTLVFHYQSTFLKIAETRTFNNQVYFFTANFVLLSALVLICLVWAFLSRSPRLSEDSKASLLFFWFEFVNVGWNFVMQLLNSMLLEGHAYLYFSGYYMGVFRCIVLPTPRFKYCVLIYVPVLWLTSLVHIVTQHLGWCNECTRWDGKDKDLDYLKSTIVHMVFSLLFNAVSCVLVYTGERESKTLYVNKVRLKQLGENYEEEKRINEEVIRNLFPNRYMEKINFFAPPDRMKLCKRVKVATLLSDFEDFTKYVSMNDCITTMNALGEVFYDFDTLCIEHNAVKCKTVGDAFTCFMDPFDHTQSKVAKCVALCEMAKKMVKCVRKRRKSNHLFSSSVPSHSPYPFNLRIGIAFDEGYLTVIGKSFLTFDVMGKVMADVQVLESRCRSNKINVDHNVRKALAKIYCFERVVKDQIYELGAKKLAYDRLDSHLELQTTMLRWIDCGRKMHRERVIARKKKSLQRKVGIGMFFRYCGNLSQSNEYRSAKSDRMFTFMNFVVLFGLLTEVLFLPTAAFLLDSFTVKFKVIELCLLAWILVVQTVCWVSSLFIVRNFYAITCFYYFHIFLFISFYLILEVSSFKFFRVLDSFVFPSICILVTSPIIHFALQYLIEVFIVLFIAVVKYRYYSNVIALDNEGFAESKEREPLYFLIIGALFSAFSWISEAHSMKVFNVSLEVMDSVKKIREKVNHTSVLLQSVFNNNNEVMERLRDASNRFKQFEFASVCFIRVFTKYNTEWQDLEFLHFIHNFFSRIDDLIAYHRYSLGLFKVKSVCNKYLMYCTAEEKEKEIGKNPARNVLRFAVLALDSFQALMEEFDVLDIHFAAGISTGRLFSGIVGHEKIICDIWGDVVNESSRISDLEENKAIWISDSTMNNLQLLPKKEDDIEENTQSASGKGIDGILDDDLFSDCFEKRRCALKGKGISTVWEVKKGIKEIVRNTEDMDDLFWERRDCKEILEEEEGFRTPGREKGNSSKKVQ